MVCQVQQLACLHSQLVRVTDAYKERHIPLMGVDQCNQLAHKELIHQSDSCPFHLLVNEGQEEGVHLFWWFLRVLPYSVCPV